MPTKSVQQKYNEAAAEMQRKRDALSAKRLAEKKPPTPPTKEEIRNAKATRLREKYTPSWIQRLNRYLSGGW